MEMAPGRRAAIAVTRRAGTRRGKKPPSIAVLPFYNMSGDPEQEYFSDGITEDVITDLSKVGGLAVIARNSSFVYKGKSVDIRAVGRELGVQSVLEGSIRRAGNRVRITAQLIDAATGAHLWADRYDRDLTDIFAVQDDVTRQIVAALRVAADASGKGAADQADPRRHLERRSARLPAARPRHPHPPDQDADGVRTGGCAAQSCAVARSRICRGPRRPRDGLQPRLPQPLVADPDSSLQRSLSLANRAIAMEPDNPFAHYVVAVVLTFLRDLDGAQREVDIALRLAPNDPYSLNARGVISTYLGNAEAALPDIELAMRLDPTFSQQYLHFLGVAHLVLGHYETAAAHFAARITADAGDGPVAWPACGRLRSSRPPRRRRQGVGGAEGDQSAIFVRGPHRPPGLPPAAGRPAHHRRFRQERHQRIGGRQASRSPRPTMMPAVAPQMTWPAKAPS